MQATFGQMMLNQPDDIRRGDLGSRHFCVDNRKSLDTTCPRSAEYQKTAKQIPEARIKAREPILLALLSE